MPGGVWSTRGRGTCILLVLALHCREKGTGRHTDVGNGGKVVCGQQFRHNRYEETSRREAGAQKDGETNNSSPGGYSVTFNARYIRFNAQFYMVLYIYVYKNSAR